MFSRAFLLDATERTVKTFVQAFAASLVVTGLDDWREALAIGVGAGVIAIASSVAGTRVGSSDSASLLPKSEEPPKG
jgi:hypothetical protein